MVRRFVLTLAFVAALGVFGIGSTREASAQFPYYGPVANFGYRTYGIVPSGGYHTAALRLGGYVPYNYNNVPYGYPGAYGGVFGPVGGVYGNSSNTIIIGR